jgi:transcriptional regulator with XRE-family HTH domain
MPPARITPNQIVGWNLKRARRARGWTQEQAAEQLEPHLGERWSVAVFSAAERSIDGTRVRHFTADELHAFARTFDQPIAYFLCPPPWAEEIGHAAGTETTPVFDYLDELFDVGENASRWVLSEVVPMTAQTTRALRQWGKNFAAMVAHREHEVAALFEAVGDRR